MAKVLVIGAGVMGLATAWQALRDGHQVELVEGASEAGGMAAHFNFDGDSIERFYHFICKTDFPTFDLLRELRMEDRLRWRPTSMGFYTDGHLHPWGNPVALLKLPNAPLLSKLRYGMLAFISTRRDAWPELENQSAKEWIIRWCGEDAYRRFWKTLLEFKFYEYADHISAAWIWTRIRRIGRSRSSIMQEELGYLDGGSQTLVDALVHSIEEQGGHIHLGSPVQFVTTSNNRVTGAETTTRHFAADYVISTVPTPHVAEMIPDLPEDWKQRYRSIQNIGVICVIYKLRKPVTHHFWVNVSIPNLTIPGVVELTNLRSEINSSIVYIPYYMPTTNEKFSWLDKDLVAEGFSCLLRLNPTLQASDIIATHVARLRYGQPVCEPGFAAKIPPVQTPITGLQIADTCYYYPEDRGIAESVRLGRAMARAIPRPIQAEKPAPSRVESTV